MSSVLAQSLYAIDGTQWSDLDLIDRDLTINENSTLTITSVAAPDRRGQFFDQNITFNRNLLIHLIVNLQGANQTTPIYQLSNNQRNSFSGSGLLQVVIDATGGNYAKSVFNFDNSTLVISNKTHISARNQSQIFSIFRMGNTNGQMATLETESDLIVDLSNTQGVFGVDGTSIRGRRAIFDNSGFTNINTRNSTTALIQLNGDIFNSGHFSLKLLNSQSFFRGHYDVSSANSSGTFTLQNGARMESEILFTPGANGTRFDLGLHSKSIARLKTTFQSPNSHYEIRANDSLLYADFVYENPNNLPAEFRAQGKITLDNGAVWYLSQSNTIDYLEVNNDISKITRENLKAIDGLSAVDMRFRDQGRELRDDLRITADNRYVLKAGQIRGSNGVFRIYGVFNREGWTPQGNMGEDNFETIATDQIVAGQFFDTHYMQVFWNANNLDKSMLNQNLEHYKIVVAKQNNNDPTSELIGAVTPIGLYNYITNLKKESMQYTTDDGTLGMGWQWIVSNVQRADNSYLSRLLDSLFQSQYRIFKMESDTFNQRMGELRDMVRVHGVWLRTKYGRFSSKSTPQTTASWDEFTSIWAGYDQNFTVLGGKNFLGIALNTTAFRNHGIAEGDDFSGESYYASSRSYGISVYDTYIFDNGFYIDSLLKYYLTNNDIAIRSEVLADNYPKFLTHGLVGSLEVGKKFRLPIRTPDFANSFYYLRPELQFTFGFISGTDWTFHDWTNQAVKARLDYDIPANFRAGLMFGREFNKTFLKGDIYFGTSVEYDINTGGDLRLEDFLDKMTLVHKDNFTWRINAGTNLILNEYWRIYFDIDTSFFGQISSTFTLNGGVRINFGRLHPVMPYVTPDREVFDPEMYRKDRRTIPEVQNYETQGILDNYSGVRKKRNFYKPPVKIKQRPYGGVRPNEPIQYGITPQVKEVPKNEPVFIDNPTSIQAPEKNYKRDATTPISPSVIPQNTRDMQSIREGLNKGYQK